MKNPKLYSNFSILFLVLLFAFSTFGQKANDKISATIVDANFCDLIGKTADYAGKTVRVKASFEIYSNEPRNFYGDCLDNEAISIKFSDGFEKSTKKNYYKQLKEKIKEKTISNVIFVGKLITGEFGADKQCAKQFIVESAEYVEVLADKPGNLTIRMQAKNFCQKNN